MEYTYPSFGLRIYLFLGKITWITMVIHCAHLRHGHDEDMADRGAATIASAETYTLVTAFRGTLKAYEMIMVELALLQFG